MRRILTLIAIATPIFSQISQGQELLDQADSRGVIIGGIRLYGASIFSEYSTSAFPQSGIAAGQSSAIDVLGGDMSYGASATIGWQRHREKTDLWVRYTGSYEGMARYSNLDAFSHSLSLNASRKLTSKWTGTLSGSGTDSTMAQYLFQPAQFMVLSQNPVSFDDFAAALAAGQFTNAQIASMLTGSPVLESPTRSLLLGSRILSYSAQSSLTYARSSRLSFQFGASAAGAQSRPGGQSGLAQNYVMTRSVEGGVRAAMTYMLSPRTEFSLGLTGNRLGNYYQSAWGTTLTAGVGRKMGSHWLLHAYGGGTRLRVTGQQTYAPKDMQFAGGGSLGIQGYTQRLVGSYDRSSFDSFGLAAGTNTTISASWDRHRPGSRWDIFGSFSQQQMRSNGFASVSGWRASGGMTAALNARMALSAEYVHLSSSGTYSGVLNNFNVDSIRVSLGWTPQPIRH